MALNTEFNYINTNIKAVLVLIIVIMAITDKQHKREPLICGVDIVAQVKIKNNSS